MNQKRPQSRLMVLMFTDIVGSVDLRRRLGDSAAADIIRKHDELFRSTVSAFAFAEILKDLGDGFLVRFSSASDAVHAALHFQNTLHTEDWRGEKLQVRIGLHLGEVSEMEVEETTGKPKLSGLAVDITARVMNLALPGQILMTRAAFDNARQYVREHQSAVGDTPAVTRKWMAHGRYLFKGAEEPLEVFEVGEIGVAPLRVPPDSDKARRAVAADQEETLGWRPAVGLEIPDRKNWILDRKLGEGGFGEVWLGEHTKSKARRVFKFCFDAERLRSFKRELMLFRLLRDALGDRNDIAKLHEVQMDEPPFYLESEFTEDGSLVEWAAAQGGIEKVPLATRLDLVARTAVAIAAAHSVGVLHKDIKPSNILIYRGNDGAPSPRITDFGIGEITDVSELAKRNIMMTEMNVSLITGNESSRTGTRMYAPPEALVGKPFTIQGDVYALGVLLYQMVVADLERPLAQGWERDVPDPLLREDIARCVEGHEAQRLSSAKELAERLQTLPARRRARRRRQIARAAVFASILLVVLLSLSALWLVRERGARLREQTLRLQREEEAKKAQAINAFIVDLLTSVDPRDGDGKDVKVVSRLNKAVTQLDDGELAHEPEVQAAVRAALGNAFRSLSQWKDAENQLQLALDTRTTAVSEPSAEFAQMLEDLGAVFWHQEKYQKAEQLFDQSLQMRTRLFGERSLEASSSINYLAAAKDRQGQGKEAEELYRKALQIRRELATGKQKELIARSLNNLGTCLRAQRRCEEAEQLFREAIDVVKELRGPDHIDIAGGLTNLGFCMLARKDYAGAKAALEESLALKRKVYGESHFSVAITLEGLAAIYRDQNLNAEAEQHYKEVLEIRRNVFSPGHPGISSALDWLSLMQQRQEKFAEAYQTLQEGLANRLITLPDDHWEVAETRSRMGACLVKLNRTAEAEPLLVQGYDSMRASQGDSSERTRTAAERLAQLYDTTGRTELAANLRTNGSAAAAPPNPVANH